MIEVRIYQNELGREPFNEWFESVRSLVAKTKILKAIEKIEIGLMSDCKSVGDGVMEYRIHSVGYRIYYSYENGRIVILLLGGDKSSQRRDINKAKLILSEYKRDGKSVPFKTE